MRCRNRQLREIVQTWHDLDYKTRGQKMGYLIGKYGLDIFIPLAAAKGINKYQTVRRANAMLTFECCSASEVSQAKIRGC